MRVATLELMLRPAGAGYAASAYLLWTGSQAESELAADVPLALDPAALLSLTLDDVAYSRALTTQFFADQRLRDAWQRARALADGASLPLRLRLRLPAGADDLHSLRWETLRDLLTDVPLACDERLHLVRYLDSPDTRPVTLGPKPDLRALLVIANPGDLGTYGLTTIHVEDEVAQLQQVLGNIPLTIVGDHKDAVSRRATSGAMEQSLRSGPAILCLICHGWRTDEGTVLWLEDDDGRGARVPGHAVAEMLSQLARPPLLTLLIACEAGGGDHHPAVLAALGPSLAQKGLGAVVAMQTKLSLPGARAFLRALFTALASHGAIDRAVSVGRAALRGSAEWWIPALWLRMRDGQLWTDEVDASSAESQAPLCSNLYAEFQPLIGRAAEVDRLLAQLTDLQRPPSTPLVIRGTFGVGKSALAHYVALRCLEDRLFDTCIWWSARYDAAHDLDSLLYTIQQTLSQGAIPTVRPELEAIRAALAKRHALIVVTKITAEDHAPIIDFLGSITQHTRVLITTTSPIRGFWGLDEIGGLSEQAALELLRSRAALEQPSLLEPYSLQTLRELCAACAYLPDTLTLAFGLIKEGAEPGELSARLRGDDGTPQLSSDDKVSLLCDSFYQKLGSPLARRALELICASADEIEAGDLIGTASLLSPGLEPGSFQQKVLQRLMSMGLVRKTRADDPQQCRYAPVNRRVRAYYLGRLRQRQRSYMALRGALAEHYAATCRRRGGENWPEHDWVARNQQELCQIMDWYADRRATESLAEMVLLTYYCFGVRGYWKPRIDYGDRAVQLLETGDEQARVRAAELRVRVTGWTRMQIGRYDEAERDFMRGRAVLEAAGDHSGLASAYRYLGTLSRRRGEYAAAAASYERAQSEAVRSADRERLLAGIWMSQSKLAEKQGQLDAAYRSLEQACVFYEQQGHRPKLAEALSRMARVCYCQGRLEEALALYMKSDEWANMVRRQKTLGYNQLGLGLIAQRQGRLDEAQACAERADALLNGIIIADEAGELSALLALKASHQPDPRKAPRSDPR